MAEREVAEREVAEDEPNQEVQEEQPRDPGSPALVYVVFQSLWLTGGFKKKINGVQKFVASLVPTVNKSLQNSLLELLAALKEVAGKVEVSYDDLEPLLREHAQRILAQKGDLIELWENIIEFLNGWKTVNKGLWDVKRELGSSDFCNSCRKFQDYYPRAYSVHITRDGRTLQNLQHAFTVLLHFCMLGKNPNDGDAGVEDGGKKICTHMLPSQVPALYTLTFRAMFAENLNNINQVAEYLPPDLDFGMQHNRRITYKLSSIVCRAEGDFRRIVEVNGRWIMQYPSDETRDVGTLRDVYSEWGAGKIMVHILFYHLI